MQNQSNSYLIMEQMDNDFSNESSHFTSFITKSNSKQCRSQSRKNQNQQLQDLLQTSTVNYGNLSNLSAQKKRLFPELSFFSKDCTQDHSSYEGYGQMMNKIHFQRSRGRELAQELVKLKEELIQKYLATIMEEFNQLSEENKKLRQVYKKQAGGGYRQKVQRNPSVKQEECIKNNEKIVHPETPTPRNSLKTGRKSINGGSVAGSQQPFTNKYNSFKPNGTKEKSFLGLGNQNFCQTQRMQAMMRQPNKMQYCESSIEIHTEQSLAPSPKRHKRRESQLTERKDYPGKENTGNDFLMILDDGREMSINNEVTGRMSQPGKMPKQRYIKEVDEQFNMKDSGHWGNGMSNNGRSNFGDTVERNSMKSVLNEQEQSVYPTSTKNIFLQFLETMLIEQRVAYAEMAQQITEVTIEAEQNFVVPSYNANIKPIQKLEKEIMTKNFKLRQLQEVINVFKAEIQQIMGTDIKIIDQLMEELLEVKGKYIQMQEKVNGMTGLKQELETKEKLKGDILASIKEKIQKSKKQAQLKNEPFSQQQQTIEPFPIPQSIKTLFDLLNIQIPANSKPIDYLNEIKELPKNKELFQAFDSKKRAQCNTKMKEVMDQIREGRKKFNEVIKIYEARIAKLQEKLMKYKAEKNHGSEQK